MMTKAGKNMRAVLERTGLYQITENSPLDWEMKAYEAGFALFEAAYEALLSELFIRTASDAVLEEWELLFRPVKAKASMEQRRAMLLTRYAAEVTSAGEAELNRVLPAAGIDGKLTEEADGSLSIVAADLLGISMEEAHRELELLMPAHLDRREKLQPLNWQFFDGLNLTWARWDRLDCAWKDIGQINWEEI